MNTIESGIALLKIKVMRLCPKFGSKELIPFLFGKKADYGVLKRDLFLKG